MCRVGNNYILIHIFKCGGTSVHETLKQLDGSSKMRVGGHLDAEAIYKNYVRNDELDEFNRKFKFSIVRNPYDWLGSTYYYIKRARGHDFNKKMNNSSIDSFVDWFIDEAMNFEREEFQNKYLTQKQFLTKDRKIDGDILVDYYTKIEDIEKNWKYILDQIKLPYEPLPKKNSNPKNVKSYKSQYGTKALKRIQETFKEDFSFFGYDI